MDMMIGDPPVSPNYIGMHDYENEDILKIYEDDCVCPYMYKPTCSTNGKVYYNQCLVKCK